MAGPVGHLFSGTLWCCCEAAGALAVSRRARGRCDATDRSWRLRPLETTTLFDPPQLPPEALPLHALHALHAQSAARPPAPLPHRARWGDGRESSVQKPTTKIAHVELRLFEVCFFLLSQNTARHHRGVPCATHCGSGP